jgi:phosphomannomutase
MTQQEEFQRQVVYRIQEITTNLTDISNNTKLLYKMLSKISEKMDIDIEDIFKESIKEIANDNAMLLQALKDEGYVENVDVEKERNAILSSFNIFKDSLDDPEKFKDEYIKEIKESINRNKEAKKNKKPKIIRPNMQEHSKFSKKN